AKGNRDILAAIEQMTRPKLVSSGRLGITLACSAPPMDPGQMDLGVTVLETGRLGELEMVVLRARDGEGLLQWLQRHNFHVPDKALPVLQSYTEQQFCFVALRFSGDALQPPRAVPAAPAAGPAAPAAAPAGETNGVFLELRFATEQPFFPLAISSVSAGEKSEILLFTITEHRQEPVDCFFAELSETKAGLRFFKIEPKFQPPGTPESLSMAIWEASRQLGRAAFAVEAAVPSFTEFDADGRPSMSHLVQQTGSSRIRKAFITRFHTVVDPEHMTHDLRFRNAAKDKRLDGTIGTTGPDSSPMLAAAMVLAPVAVRGLGRFRRTRRRTRWAAVAAALALLALA
ncbi:MAG TPA: DUF2330 domain-containing protein, partial [Phycisphaerae bacterium]|nr:DUF2330 domain-containing protein [Phycisphaerae bacterium]